MPDLLLRCIESKKTCLGRVRVEAWSTTSSRNFAIWSASAEPLVLISASNELCSRFGSGLTMKSPCLPKTWSSDSIICGRRQGAARVSGVLGSSQRAAGSVRPGELSNVGGRPTSHLLLAVAGGRRGRQRQHEKNNPHGADESFSRPVLAGGWRVWRTRRRS